MPAVTVSLSADQLQKRMQDRLRGLNPAAPNTVLWQQTNSRVLLFVDSLRARVIPGWLVCDVDLQSDATGRQTLQFVFYLGTSGQGDGLHASATINAGNPQASQLAEVWGATTQRVLWDAVLDGLEAFVSQVAAKFPGQAVNMLGFQAAANTLSAVVMAGDK
jgi:hypothetical protein